jgi:hypothetical protein
VSVAQETVSLPEVLPTHENWQERYTRFHENLREGLMRSPAGITQHSSLGPKWYWSFTSSSADSCRL